MYPRNLTCYYHIRQTRVPDGKVALIRVRQRNPHLIYIKDRNAPHLSRERKLQVGSACHVLYDYLVAYDGNSTGAPILATWSQSSPSSASPFDFPFQDSPRRRTFGFELDVEVEFVDRESTAYIREGSTCDYMVSSRGQRSGYVQSPVHSLLPNTTCTWRLLAGSTEVVWLYFLHYRHILHPEMPTPSHCNTLTITEGDNLLEPTESTVTMMDSIVNNTMNVTEENVTSLSIMGEFCRPDRLPRVCSGVHAPGQHTAPCLPGESYISNSPVLTLSLRYAAGTAPAHVEFLAHVFLFGRGGVRKLRCVYTFVAEPDERIVLRIIRSRMGSSCGTLFKHSSRRYECSHDGAADKPAIWMRERPWEGVPLIRACLCNISHEQPFVLISYTNEIQIIFSIPVMTPSSDYNDYFLEGDYSIVDATSICPDQNNNYAHVFSSGWHGPNQTMMEELAATDLWNTSVNMNIGQSNYYYHQQQLEYQKRGRHRQRKQQQESRDLVVEYVGNSTGRMITWIGVWRPMQTAPLSPVGVDLCPHRCPEIQACLPADLWCDRTSTALRSGRGRGGVRSLAALPWVYLAASIVLFIS
ncbi:uncharacterized protein LOC121863889 [Homarus americanus]|uniref:uncharacterized protein LOC121863889 n=1 Tax=Homarus americanus TaxID=6706 RepID=UPI001C48EEBA|nr:uncharacterized protein LOC121863889 [Homarus americanus]